MVWIENDVEEAVIVTAEDPYSIAAYAAEEMVYHIKRATGVTIPVRKESENISSVKHRIYIGQSNAARKAGIVHKDLESEQCIIRSTGDDFFIVGNDGDGDPLDFHNHHSGTLWGVYELLERTLGVRWLWPGELGTHVPPANRIEIGEWNETIKPVMVRRHIRTRIPRWQDDRLRKQWQKWKDTGATLYYRPNYMYNGGSMPHVFARQMAEEFQYVYQNGSIGTDFDALTGQWAVNGTTLYLLSRLHNSPDNSIGELLNEYYLAFGPAALHIKAYFDFWEAHTTSNRAIYGFGGSLETYHRRGHEMFPPESFDQAGQILVEAANVVADEKNRQYAQRIEFLRKGLEHTQKEAKLAKMFNDEKTNTEEWNEALQDLVGFRHETEHMHIANFANSADNDRMAWGERFKGKNDK